MSSIAIGVLELNKKITDVMLLPTNIDILTFHIQLQRSKHVNHDFNYITSIILVEIAVESLENTRFALFPLPFMASKIGKSN